MWLGKEIMADGKVLLQDHHVPASYVTEDPEQLLLENFREYMIKSATPHPSLPQFPRFMC